MGYPRTISVEHDEELRRLGVEKRHKLVSPVAARQIAEWYGIDL